MVDSLYLPFLTLLFHVSGIGWIAFLINTRKPWPTQRYYTPTNSEISFSRRELPLVGFAESTGTYTVCHAVPKAFSS